MTADASQVLLDELRADGVQLWVHDGSLRYRPHPALSQDRIDALRAARYEIAALLEDGPQSAEDSLAAGQRPDPLPLSHAQEGLWFLDRFDSLGSAYNIVTAAEVSGPVDLVVLERSVREIVRRHEALRTLIRTVDGVGIQVVSEPQPGQFQSTDLRRLDEPERAQAVTRHLAAHAEHRFRMDQECAFMVEILVLGSDKHVLIITVHHLLFDGRSAEILFRELHTVYEAFLASAPSPLPELPAGYPDYAVWERSVRNEERLRQQAAYWKARLSGTPEALPLPLDHERPLVPDFRGETLLFPIQASLVSELRALGNRHGATLFMVLLTAYHVLLAEWTGEQDVSVGVPVDGRAHRDAEDMIGCFVNTVVIRASAAAQDDFIAILSRIRDAVIEAHDHRHVPFHRVVAEIGQPRPVSGQPLFQVMFSHLVEDNPRLGNETDLKLMEPEGTSAKFDLSLFAAEQGDKVTCTLEFATALFERASIERLAVRYLRILETMAAAPATLAGNLPLPQAELDLLIRRWNTDDPSIDTGHTLPELIEDSAAAHPDAPAVVCDDGGLTYGELNKLANRVAHRLRSAGIGAESVVAVCAERSPELVVALLGVLKSGAAYLPLDPSYPAERLTYMLADSLADALLTTEGLALTITSGLSLPLEAVLEPDGVWGQWPDTNPAPEIVPDNAAYVIYTSGSTGRPKGVVVAHRGVVNRFAWQQRVIPLAPDDVVLHKTPVSFDVSVWELFLPLAVGARLVLAAPERQGDPAHLRDLIRRYDVTTAHFVPSMLRAFMAGNEDEAALRHSTLRYVVCSGEELPTDLVDRFQAAYACELYNLYGPTEASIDVTLWRCQAGERVRTPIGRPAPNVPLYVLDEALRPVPAGAVGNLYIGGVQVARGYRGRAGLTAERFVPDPFSDGGQRMYRSGDMARWRAGGVLEFLGRTDFQVKVRGFRIELGEVESALRQAEGVADVVAVARDDRVGGRQLIAYVVPANDSLDIPGLREFAATRLPDYMVPSKFTRLERLPLSANGKVDRTALPNPVIEVIAEEDRVKPSTPAELAVAEIWREVLDIEQIGVGDSFFALGGHSLSAVQVLARLERRLGVAVPLATFYTRPTLAHLARLTEAAIRPQLTTQETSLANRLLEEAARRGMSVDVEEGKLRYTAPGATLDERTIALLERHGDLIVRCLTARPRATASPWLRPLTSAADPIATLFVIPAAGSGPSAYRSWAEVIPRDLEVLCLHLPGREERFDENLFTEAAPLAEHIAREISSHLDGTDRPFALFGHSAGGLIAFEVARRLDDPELRLLAVAASAPPDRCDTTDRAATDEELIEALHAWGATPVELLADPAAVAAFLPRLRADLEVFASCQRKWHEAARLAVDLIAFGGSNDESVDPDDVLAWARWTTGRFSAHTLDGGHYFPVPEGARLIDIIIKALSETSRVPELQKKGGDLA